MTGGSSVRFLCNRCPVTLGKDQTTEMCVWRPPIFTSHRCFGKLCDWGTFNPIALQFWMDRVHWMAQLNSWVTLGTNVSPRLRGYSTNFLCKAGRQVLPTSWRWSLELFIAHAFSDLEEHALVADKKERPGHCVTRIVPSVTRVSPGSNSVSKRVLACLK